MEYTIYELLFFYFDTRLLDGAEKRFLLPCAEAIFIIAVCLVFPSAFLTVL